MGGASSKSTFSSIVQQILISDIESNNHSFWDDMWKTVLTASDVFDLISADDVRKIIEDHPENMKIIVTQAVAQLYQVVETPYPIYFDQALNCSRILARLLPFLMETNSPTMKELLWSRRTNVKPDSTNNLETADESDSSEPLAVILVNTIFHLMFLPEFTVEDPNTEFTESDIHTPEFKSALMWAPGVGCSEKTVVNSTQFDENRIDVLRLMIAAFCDSLYQSADCYDSCASMWLEVATSADAPYAEIVFYSLMNTVLGYDPIGWGVPYGNMMSTDTAKIVMEHSVQALVILLDYGHPMRTLDSAANGTALPSVNATDTEAQGFNVFRRLLGSVEAPDQLNFMYRGFVRLLNNVHQAESTYLPYSITRIGIEQELLILFWKCLEEVPTFMPYILKHCDITEIFVPICYFLLE
ncbi:high-temperature-induced dauer-formation protein-domain-containing protein, partial [Ochromonadaceae sp. CCMP2298]